MIAVSMNRHRARRYPAAGLQFVSLARAPAEPVRYGGVTYGRKKMAERIAVVTAERAASAAPSRAC